MIATALGILAAWIGLNAGFVAMRLYVGSERMPPSESLQLGTPPDRHHLRLVS